MSRGRREVSELEAAFFREMLKDTQPLKHKSAPRQIAKPARPLLRAEPFPASTPLPKAPVYSDGYAPGIGGHRAAHLRKGRLEPEAKLDLHGYRVEPAYRARHGAARGAGRHRKRRSATRHVSALAWRIGVSKSHRRNQRRPCQTWR